MFPPRLSQNVESSLDLGSSGGPVTLKHYSTLDKSLKINVYLYPTERQGTLISKYFTEQNAKCMIFYWPFILLLILIDRP